MKKSIFTMVVSLFLIFLTMEVNAQQNFQVVFKMPPPGTLNLNDLYNITVTNKSGSDLSGYLVGTAKEDKDGMIAKGTTVPILFKKGINNIKIKDLPKTPDVEYIASDPRYKESLIRQGKFPSGKYEICVKVISAATNEELGSDCINQEVLESGLLTLINPTDGEDIDSKVPVTFTWSSGGKVPEGGYTLKICEVMKNQTPETAMKSNKAWFEQKGINSTTFAFPNSAKGFEEGKKYAWVVNSVKSESEVWVMNLISKVSDEQGNITKILFPKDKDTLYGKSLYVIWNNNSADKGKYTYSINVSDATNGKEIFSKYEIKDTIVKIENYEKNESTKLKIVLTTRIQNVPPISITIYVERPRNCFDFHLAPEGTVNAIIYSWANYNGTSYIDDVSIPSTDWILPQEITLNNDPYTSLKLLFFVNYVISPSVPTDLTLTIQDLGVIPPRDPIADPIPGKPIPNYASNIRETMCNNYNNNSTPVFSKTFPRNMYGFNFTEIDLLSSPLISGHKYLLRVFDQNTPSCNVAYMFNLIYQ